MLIVRIIARLGIKREKEEGREREGEAQRRSAPGCNHLIAEARKADDEER